MTEGRPGDDPSFDDDSLAAAMAAEVAAYTSPVSLTRRDHDGGGLSAAELFAGGSTLEAIERLEQELRRLSGHPDETETAEQAPRARPPQTAPAAPAAEAATAVTDPEPPGRVFPRAYQPFSPFTPTPSAEAEAEAPNVGPAHTAGPAHAAVPADASGPASPAPTATPVPAAAPPFAPPTLVAPETLDLRASAGQDAQIGAPDAPESALPPGKSPAEPVPDDETTVSESPEPPDPTPVDPRPAAQAPRHEAPRHGAARFARPELVEPIATGSALSDISTLPPPVGVDPTPLPAHDRAIDVSTFPPPTGPSVPIEPPPITAGFAAPTADDQPVEGLPEPDGLDDEDDVDEIDRVPTPSVLPIAATSSEATEVPAEPIPMSQVMTAESAAPHEHRAFAIEEAGLEPTALDLRAGRATRLFWLWFAANSSVVSLALGATLFQLGMSLRQAIVATLAGVAISFLPLGLGTLAGKWSGQPTMVVSRASFGVVGNVVPAALAVLSRAFWGGVLLWLLAASVGRVLTDAGLDGGLGEHVWTLIGLGGGFALATVIAVFGYGLVVRMQLGLSILTAVLIVGAAVLTYSRLDLGAALTTGDGPWILVVTGAVLVFSFVGLAWVHSSSDLARYQRPTGYGGTSMLWATFGATLPAFALIAWGAMLAASDPEIAEGLATAPLRTIAALLPAWYPAPLLLAAGLGLLSGAVLTIYSAGFALQSAGLRSRRLIATLIAAIPVLAVALVFVFFIPDTREVMRDAATTLAVPVAAWAGIFAAEMMIRTRRFHAPSLLARGGVYPDVRWVNLIALALITALGFGLTSSTVPGLAWQGFLFPLIGLQSEDPLATSDIGVFVALALGLVVPLVSGIPAIRRQEADREAS